MRAARSSRKVLSVSGVAIGTGRKRASRLRQSRPIQPVAKGFVMVAGGLVMRSGVGESGILSSYSIRCRHAASGHLVVVLVLPSAELRLVGVVLDADRAVHVCDLPSARFTQLHIPLVPAPYRLADAADSLYHALDRAADRARADRRVLGGARARGVFHGVVLRGPHAAHGAVIRRCWTAKPCFRSCLAYASSTASSRPISSSRSRSQPS